MRPERRRLGALPVTDPADLQDRKFVIGRTLEEKIGHLLRRAGFGASPAELAAYTALGYEGAVERLVYFEKVPDLVDSWIGQPGYAAVVPENQRENYLPNYLLHHAKARWLFRMLYSPRPLQEKMALFWHNHFATGWSKIAGDVGHVEATRLMAAVPSEDPGLQMGQIEMFRMRALDSFFNLVLAVTQDPAMLYWLDGRLNVKSAPQENYGREVMELFTRGIADASGAPNYTEDDVKAAARVFTGWNLRSRQVTTVQIGDNEQRVRQYTFFYDAENHDRDAKVFSFPIYAGVFPTIPARPPSTGIQDGLDLLAALVDHHSTAHRLATKLYQFFVNDADLPASAVTTIAGWLRESGFDMRVVMYRLFMSDFFLEEANFSARYRWPVEHVIGTLKVVGPGSIPMQTYAYYVEQMNELLFDPPSVEGYRGGPTWINSNTMLARTEFSRVMAAHRRADLVEFIEAEGAHQNPELLVDFLLQWLGVTRPEPILREELIQYVVSGAGANWIGSRTQLWYKVAGLIHLIGGTAEYAFA